MAAGQPAKLLIVTSDRQFGAAQQNRLRHAGYDVALAGTAAETVAQVRESAFDLLVLDNSVSSRQSGLALYQQLQAAGFDLPAILVVEPNDPTTAVAAVRAGILDLVARSNGDLEHLNETVSRIIAKKQAHRQLVESEARLSTVVNTAKDAIIVTQSDQRVVLFNVAAESMFRCSAADALGLPLTRFIPLEFVAPASKHDSLKQDPTSLTHRIQSGSRGVRADGTEFPLEASLSRAQVSGKTLYTIVVRDITERKHAEEQIREQAALLANAQDAILVLDLQGRIRFWNQAAVRLYGWTVSETLGHHDLDLLAKASVSRVEEARRAVIEHGEWSGDLQYVDKKGRPILTESRWTLMRDADNSPKSILVISTDVTEKRKLEAQYLRAQRIESIGTLAGGIAHDLNNMLTPITMALDFLKQPLSDPERLSILEILRASAERASEMVQQVILFARGADGERGPLQLRRIIGETEKMLRHTLPKSIGLECSLADDLWPVAGDATQISQVLMNLCVNARDAMPEGGQLAIAAENTLVDENSPRAHPDVRPGRFVVIHVSDTGMGIPSALLDKVFDPFFTTKEHGKGTGLGLSTVLGIAKSHAGFINVYSDVGRGSRFSVYLPAASLPSTVATEENGAVPCGQGETILVVDDETAVREVTKAILEANGYRVLLASGGKEALALFARHRQAIRLVLTDMMMPEMDGRATIRELRRLDPQVQVVAASGLASDEHSAPEPGAELQAFLMKPFTASKLLRTLHAQLARPNVLLGPANGQGKHETSGVHAG